MSGSGPSCKRAFAALLAGTMVAVLGVLTAALMADWFSWVNNALSDLGHVVRHRDTAIVFNGSLILGGSLIALGSGLLINRGEAGAGLAYFLVGLGLSLVGGFDEAYGSTHFVVSVFLFISMALLLIAVSYSSRSPYPLISLAVGASAWALHLAMEIPRGAAIPEIVSVIATLPWAIAYVYRRCLA